MYKKFLELIKKRKLLVVVILLFFVVNIFVIYNTFSEKTTSSIWDGKVADHFKDGSGTSIDPYIISDGRELAFFFTIINKEENDEYFNKFYKITNNIDLNNREFSFSGFNKAFSGSLDGNGYTISNLVISNYNFDDENGIANYNLFDSLYAADIRNINFNGVTFKVDSGVLNKVEKVIEEPTTKEEEPKVDDIPNIDEPDKKDEEVKTEEEEVVKETTANITKYSVRFINNDEEEGASNEGDSSESTDVNNAEANKTEPKAEEPKTEDPKTNEDPVVPEPKEDEIPNEVDPNEGTEEPKTDDTTEEPKTNDDGEENTTEPINPEDGNDDTNTTEPADTKELEEITDAVKNTNVIEIRVNGISVSLFRRVKSSSIKNISVNNIKIELDGKDEKIDSSLFILDDEGENTIENININGSSETKKASVLINNYNDSSFKNIIYSADKLVFIYNYSIKSSDSVYRYTVKEDKLTFDGNYPIKSIVDLMNSNSSLEWKFENNKFRILNNGSDKKNTIKAAKATTRTAPSAHASGKSGTTIYVNDYDADLAYYEGLNYTTPSGTSIPTMTHKNLYNDSNLVFVQINYHGTNKAGNLTGVVSASENEKDFIYYKVLPVENNKILIELIDDPFTKRPNNKTFNGWITDYQGTNIYLDTDTYVRYAEVPVTFTNGVPDNITIDIYADWNNGVIRNWQTSWNSTVSYLKSKGFNPISELEITYESVTPYYVRNRTGTNGNSRKYPSGAVNANGQPLTGSCSGCYYYIHATGNYNASTQYYNFVNGTMTPYDIEEYYNYTSEIPVGNSIAGYYRKVSLPGGTSYKGYYDDDGNYLTSGSCPQNQTCNDYYELIQYYDENNAPEVVQDREIYYYLTTRDTNIVVLNRNVTGVWGTGQAKPFTFTAINNNSNYMANYYWSLNGYTAICYTDMRFENLRIYSNIQIANGSYNLSGNGAIMGNNNNVKIGRHITSSNAQRVALGYAMGGGTSAVNTLNRYRFIVESGTYNGLSLSTRYNTSSTSTVRINATGIYGSDYERVTNDDMETSSDLEVRYIAAGSYSAYIYGADSEDIALSTIVKSGRFGTNKHDVYAGIYVGGLSAGRHYAGRSIVVEGGYIYNLIGGPLSQSSMANKNDTYIYFKGGSADIIVGGAGRTGTYGNKIIQVTGGEINYAVFGGSNGVEGNDSDQKGTIDGDTFVYIGGDATIGDEDLVEDEEIEENSLVEAGSVFGIGNGRSGYDAIGTVDNSYVIIDGDATINKNVYGGGNYGATGQNGSNQTYETIINIQGGTIKGSVYGGGNNNGAGSTSNTTDVTINMTSGTVNGSIYGGSRTKGRIYGDTTLNILAGTIRTDVYGGGEGGYSSNTNYGTFVRDNVAITIGDSNAGPVISGSVYGGSAYGTVNATSTTANANNKTVSVTVNKGTIGSVFGGAKGDDDYTPHIKGDITVDINGGTITNVFGGFDAAGKPEGDCVVYIDGGTITNAYGGGNETSIDNTHINLRGGSVTTLYGGSNQSGDVINTDVNISGGTVGTVYGGNNAGGTCSTTDVDVTGGQINTAIYGGGNLVDTTTTNVDITNIASGTTIPSVFGGGNNAGVTTTNVTLNGANVKATNVYGGSNQAGTVTTSNVEITASQVTTVYGGNNAGGSTTSPHVLINSGTFTTIYGGGNEAQSGDTEVIIHSGTATTVYGGGNKATTGDTDVTINNGNITTLYGGGNQASAGDTDVTINNGTITTLFGGGNQATAGDTNVEINNGSLTHIYGGGNEADVEDVSVTINSVASAITDIYGGGNKSGATSTTVVIGSTNGSNITATNVYGGSNTSGTVGSSDVTINKGTYTNVYGGNNAGGSTTTTKVTVETGNITTLYGGGNEAQSGNTEVIINGGTIPTVFGGGNKASSGDTDVTINNGTITTVYGGGNQATAGDTNVEINNGTLTHIYGGGNEADVQDTNIAINNVAAAITDVFGGGNKAGASSTTVVIGTVTNPNISATSVFGGSNTSGTVGSSDVTLHGGTYTNVYGGNNEGGVTGTASVTVNGSTITNLYGGGNKAETTSTVLTINSGTITDAYGGGNLAKVRTNANLLMTGGTVSAIFGGGNAADVDGNTDLTMLGGTTSGNIYGGGNEGKVGGNSSVLIHNSTIGGSAYAGGNGQSATVLGNTDITISGTSIIGTSSCSLPSTCSVFGGGNAAATGSELTNNSTASVNIKGATIYGNVYGGANTSKVYGETSVTIGADVPAATNVVQGDVYIRGTVFGGGEANASGSTTYDFSFISVTRGVSMLINAAGYNNFSVDGSFFGSGNASSSEGESEIVIKNYGTFANPQRNISIQRANLVTLDNCNIVLEGTTDRTNEWSDVVFSLSRVDELDIKNNTSIFLENGANLLKDFKSLNADGSYATVSIDSNGNVTRSTNNRLYMFAGKHLDIAKDQNATDMGEVSGMTFFGMYKYNTNNGTINPGIYGNETNGGDVDWSKVFDNVTSYVAGLHKTNHNIQADGFYTNYADEATGKYKIDYIEPTPPSGPLYMWIIGAGVIEYEVDLNASRYSTLGTTELSLRDFTNPNTTFSILGFDYSELENGVTLIEKTQVKKIADTSTEANNVMGISMETSNAGWLNNAQTSFVTDPDNSVIGTTDYVGGSQSGAPTVLLYLHHSKNIATAGDMGKVKIQLMSIRQINALDKETKRLIITINLSRTLYDTISYEGSMTAGRKYEMFTSTATNIASHSSISAYFALFATDENIYKTGYHRTLVSTFVFPLNTKITMIDLSGDTPTYYYKVINASDVTRAQNELQNVGEVSYNISMFEIMGAENSGVYYDDVQKNIDYYSSSPEYCEEEFIFIIDFADTNMNANSLQNKLLLEMRNSSDATIYSVLAPQHDDLTYNIYANRDAVIDMSGTISSNKIYNGESFTADIHIDYTQSVIGSTVIYDTHYFDSKLGIKISLLNSQSDVVTGTTLLGLNYVIDEVRYDPNIDGTTRIKIADKVDSAEKWIIINTGTATIPTGHYKLKIESFGSPDGIYYGLNSSDYIEFNIEIINEIYGLNVETTPEEMIINAETGLNENKQNTLKYNISYNSGLTNPSIHVKMYRRGYNTIDDTSYHVVDAQDYFSNTFTSTSKPNEYLVVSGPEEEFDFTFTNKTDLMTGTYKLEFILYDDNSVIGSVDKYIIIK